MEKTVWYKVLLGNESPVVKREGKSFKWSLPKDGKPGKWQKVNGRLTNCVNGIHLTDNPGPWITYASNNLKIYIAEYQGERLGRQGDKICCRKVRLVRELTKAEMGKFGIYVNQTRIRAKRVFCKNDFLRLVNCNNVSIDKNTGWDATSIVKYGTTYYNKETQQRVASWVYP